MRVEVLISCLISSYTESIFLLEVKVKVIINWDRRDAHLLTGCCDDSSAGSPARSGESHHLIPSHIQQEPAIPTYEQLENHLPTAVAVPCHRSSPKLDPYSVTATAIPEYNYEVIRAQYNYIEPT